MIPTPAPIGSQPGLLASFYNLPAFNYCAEFPDPIGDPVVTRVDPAIDFVWNSGGPAPSVSKECLALINSIWPILMPLESQMGQAQIATLLVTQFLPQ